MLTGKPKLSALLAGAQAMPGVIRVKQFGRIPSSSSLKSEPGARSFTLTWRLSSSGEIIILIEFQHPKVGKKSGRTQNPWATMLRVQLLSNGARRATFRGGGPEHGSHHASVCTLRLNQHRISDMKNPALPPPTGSTVWASRI